MPDSPHDPIAAIPDATAQRLIARAIELDAPRAAGVSVAQLRDAVVESGVSPAAFDAALAELRATLRAAPAPLVPAPDAPRRGIAGLWTRLRDGVRDARPPVPASPLDRAARDGLAFVAFWGMLVLLDNAADAAAVAWPAQKLVHVVATALGAALAHRLGARVARPVLAVLAVAQGAELAMDLVFGAPAVIGAAGHWALILASALGVGVGALLGRRRDAASAPTSSAPASPAVDTAAAQRAGVPDAPRRLLRLRHAWLPRPAAS